jgi:hypothetical protein
MGKIKYFIKSLNTKFLLDNQFMICYYNIVKIISTHIFVKKYVMVTSGDLPSVG